MKSGRDVGIAISGGGHRATVFGLGALLAAVDLDLNGQVASISSVSGGSIANGIVMTGPDYGNVDRAAFEDRIAPCLRSIANRGILLGGAPATAGYLRAFVAAAIGALFGLIGVLVCAIFDLWIGLFVSLIVAVVLLVVVWWLFRQRSVRTERAIDRELLGNDQLTLAQVRSRSAGVHHVICTTELQTGESFYFTNRVVYAYRFGSAASDIDVSLATAVQASACVPGAFAPRVIALTDLGVHPPKNRAGEQNIEVSSIVVNDGGVYDNMADQWEYGFVGRRESWPELAEIQPDRGSYIIVVNGSGGWNDPKPIGRSGIAREIAGLSRSQGVQYDVSTARRRQALYDRFTENDAGQPDATRGVFVQITDSPYRLPQIFLTEPMHARFPEQADRAQEAINFLNDQGYQPASWDDIAKRTSGVPTTLAKLGEACTAELLEHGYVLTMVNLYVLSGRGSLLNIDRDRFRRLCR